MPGYQTAEHLEKLSRELEAVEHGDIKRLLVVMPPRHGKTELCSIKFPAWYLGRHPQRQIIGCSYAENLAYSNSYAIRETIIGQKYQNLWQCQLDVAGAIRWQLAGKENKRSNYIAAGVGGGITGEGADCLPAETLIKTEYGQLDIEHLCMLYYKVRVWAFDIKKQRPVLRKVVAAREIKVDELIEITTASGRTIRATPNHRFCADGLHYKPASLLTIGDKLITFNNMPDLQGAERQAQQNVSSLLFQNTTAKNNSQMRLVRKGISERVLHSGTFKKAKLQRHLLLSGMLQSASRSEKRSQMRDMRQTDAGESRESLLLCRVPGESETDKSQGVQMVRRDVQTQKPFNTTLFRDLRGCSAFGENDWQGKLELENRNELCQTLRRNEVADNGAGQPSMRCLSANGAIRTRQMERANSKPDEFNCASYQREQNRKLTREYGHSLQKVPLNQSQIETDTVAVVKHLRNGSYTVYDIQVEEDCNFFANEILVHNCLIIDDPIKNAAEAESAVVRESVWQWYITTAITRLQPGGTVILIMTRWHADDLAGRLLRLASNDPKADQWRVLHFPAINNGKALWPERFSLEYLEKIRSSTIENVDEPGRGSRAFASLYQGEPTIAEGQIFNRSWWKYYKEPPTFKRVIHSWDTAFKDKTQNDYSVCTVWGEAQNGYYLLDIWRQKVEYPELKRAAINLHARDHTSVVYIEDKASGQSLIQELKRDTAIPLLPVKVDSDKTARAYAVTPLIEAGKVFLPEAATWLHDFIEELSAFPNGEHDDQVDSVTQALRQMTTCNSFSTWDTYLKSKIEQQQGEQEKQHG